MTMTPKQRRAYANDLILAHAKNVEFLAIFEAAEENPHADDNITDEDAHEVARLIEKAIVTVTWLESDLYPRTIECPHCSETLQVPPHGDREDAMRPHLPNCSGLQ